MRIGVLSDFRAANTIYRAVPVVRLEQRGHVIALDRCETRATRAQLHGCDVVHIYREHDKATIELARTLRAEGTAVVWDVDDHLGAVPENTPGRLARGALEEQRMLSGIRAMASTVHLVTTTSEPLADLYRSYGADEVRIVPNFVPDAFLQERPRPHAGLVIGWIASAEHYHDMRALRLSETLAALLDAHPQLRVASIGVRFDLPGDRYDHRVMVQYHRLHEYIAGFDIGLAPLDDIPFNRARSDVKVKEYSAVGIPWLASPVGPYVGHGEKQGGRLVPADGWYAAIDRLVVKERERRKLAKRAASWGREQIVSRNLDAWESVMVEAAERAGRLQRA
jgi:glycosyltransferase involved in cell wall biosynthesis